MTPTIPPSARGRPPTAASPGRPAPLWRPRFHAAGLVNAGSVAELALAVVEEPVGAARRSASGRARQGLDEDRDRVIGQDAEVRRVEAGVAAGRDEARVDDALHVPCRHESGRRDKVERDQRRRPR